jgi:hypothetical protein
VGIGDNRTSHPISFFVTELPPDRIPQHSIPPMEQFEFPTDLNIPSNRVELVKTAYSISDSEALNDDESVGANLRD